MEEFEDTLGIEKGHTVRIPHEGAHCFEVGDTVSYVGVFDSSDGTYLFVDKDECQQWLYEFDWEEIEK